MAAGYISAGSIVDHMEALGFDRTGYGFIESRMRADSLGCGRKYRTNAVKR